MTFEMRMGLPEMEALWTGLLAKAQLGKLNADEQAFFDKWTKALVHLSANPKHPGLRTHEIDELTQKFGVKVWQSYLENHTSGARRMYWAYGPEARQITILAVESHPESGKRKAYERIALSAFPQGKASDKEKSTARVGKRKR